MVPCPVFRKQACSMINKIYMVIGQDNNYFIPETKLQLCPAVFLLYIGLTKFTIQQGTLGDLITMRMVFTLFSVIFISFALSTVSVSAKPVKGKRVTVKSVGPRATTPNLGGYSYYETDSMNLGNKYEFETPLGLDNANRNNANPYLSGNLSTDNMWWGR